MQEYLLIGLVIALPLWTLFCLRMGYRWGRESIDRPLPPIIETKQPEPVQFDDPYEEALYGEREKRIATVEEDK